jgi:hypothetical protein
VPIDGTQLRFLPRLRDRPCQPSRAAGRIVQPTCSGRRLQRARRRTGRSGIAGSASSEAQSGRRLPIGCFSYWALAGTTSTGRKRHSAILTESARAQAAVSSLLPGALRAPSCSARFRD